MNNIKNAIYVISKLDFNDLAVGAKPTSIKDNNSGVGLQWSVYEVNGGEIKEVDGIKILNFKTNNYKLFTTMSGADLKNGSIQFEADILIPNMKADNIFFNIGNSSNTGFRFNIKNTFRNGLEVIFGSSRVAFNFLFESNKKYNIVVSKDYNVYSLYVDGIIVGHCVSNDFNNLININTTPTITIGAHASATTNTVDQFIGEISNVNISFGMDSNKYSNSFTKYGDHLISRLNFGNLASASSSTVFTPGLEAVIDSPMNWVYGNVTAGGEFGMLDGSPFSSSIGDVGTIYFTMITDKNVSDSELINFNDQYKVVYTFNVDDEYQPEATVNGYTTSALNFENELVDKVGTTMWQKGEKFTLTNGVEAETIEFTEVKERDVKITTNTDTVTLRVDNIEIEVPKTSTINNIELFKDYTSQIKDVRVYDIPLPDDDEFIGSVLIDTQYPELEMLDDDEELHVIDVGDFVIKGFIEGGVGRKYIIRNKVENFELIEGTDDYLYDGIDERYIDNYEIYEVESKQSYPLPKHVMERGVISGIVDTGKCNGAISKIEPSDMTAWCYSNKDQRLIGSYPVSLDGTYLIPNLDVHTRYDIIFKHNSRLIENISSSYRKPKRVEDAKNPRIIGIDYEYNQNSSFIKYTWQYSTNVTFSSVKLYITENQIIDNTTPFIELGNNANHYNDYNVTHDHQYYVTIVATYEGNEYRSNQMLVNTYDRTPTVITSVEFNKTTGNILITW